MKMHRLIQVAEQVAQSEQLARAAAGASIAGTSLAWLGPLNEILTAIATIIAIVSGLYAIRFYYKKGKDGEAE